MRLEGLSGRSGQAPRRRRQSECGSVSWADMAKHSISHRTKSEG